ncbi:MAG: sensor histidine kinase [Planctomycetota bacterium]|jgi:signal transduction histidine kinase
MAPRTDSVLQTKFFYVGSIFAVSFGLISLMWRFKTVNWILVAFGLAWVVVVTAFAWEIVTRAERLDATVKARTEALKESNRNLSALLEQLSAFHTISYEINQRLHVPEITQAFCGRLCTLLPGVAAAWLWLDRRLLEDGMGPSEERDGEARPLELAAHAGRGFGMPQELDLLWSDNPLTARCFDGRSVTVDHNLHGKALAWGWEWLASARLESFAGFPLHLGGTMLGVLGVFSSRTISAEFISQLHLSVNQLTVALEKARLLKEMRLRAEELASANEELRQLDAMKDWFVSSVSHEMRTPLTNIRSFGEILESYDDLSPGERREFAGIIRNESERLTEIVSDVLDLAKMADGELHLEPEPFDLMPLIERCLKTFSQEAEERDIQLVQSVPAALPQVYADGNAVARVLNNLMSNAFKFTPDGGRIEVAAELSNGQSDRPEAVAVMVSDTGVGIPLRDQPRVFERFTQVGRRLAEKPSGTGIGLAICQEIIEELQGEIWVQSAPGEGSTFGFSLPLAPPA